ncbi:hypothetical protein C4D60_Mb01t04250 [Musa balbisiana]|uniref:Uncharacterized protein n=1 Tax=Musa balbisiana TaxID=52838 RepID=A0A4S8JJR5_MUSBA|nr:hypothetical protein C4D60_Mb01t04250 [Musa balbisiana]
MVLTREREKFQTQVPPLLSRAKQVKHSSFAMKSQQKEPKPWLSSKQGFPASRQDTEACVDYESIHWRDQPKADLRFEFPYTQNKIEQVILSAPTPLDSIELLPRLTQQQLYLKELLAAGTRTSLLEESLASSSNPAPTLSSDVAPTDDPEPAPLILLLIPFLSKDSSRLAEPLSVDFDTADSLLEESIVRADLLDLDTACNR